MHGNGNTGGDGGRFMGVASSLSIHVYNGLIASCSCIYARRLAPEVRATQLAGAAARR
jgi:hypothetical protein